MHCKHCGWHRCDPPRLQAIKVEAPVTLIYPVVALDAWDCCCISSPGFTRSYMESVTQVHNRGDFGLRLDSLSCNP